MNAEIFRHNLREMLRTKGLKQREFAEKAGLSYPWVRKVCSQGLTRVEDRNREQLGKICEILGVSPIEQMWNRNLLDQRDEASMYAAKVEKILRASCTSSDFIRYESVGGVSVMELADQIDKVHEAYESDRSSLEDRQSRRLTAQQSSGGRRTSHASEYTEKLRSLLRDDRPELRQQVSAILQLIDGAYHIDEGKRLEQRLKNERPDAHKRWLSSFGGNVGEVISELASTVPGKDEDELLDQLAEHEPPDKSEALLLLDSLKQRQAELSTVETTGCEDDIEAWFDSGKKGNRDANANANLNRFRKHIIPPATKHRK